MLDQIHDVEQRYHIDLLPALTLLTVTFVFHQYKKRVQAKAELAAVSRDMDRTRARTEELERLLTLGRALGRRSSSSSGRCCRCSWATASAAC